MEYVALPSQVVVPKHVLDLTMDRLKQLASLQEDHPILRELIAISVDPEHTIPDAIQYILIQLWLLEHDGKMNDHIRAIVLSMIEKGKINLG